ncbi:mitochondrial ribosomal protein precursor, small subunit [Candida dubliniensis CD36]|uniref:Mitochondrial ribosomal protein, small subunit n=1 Tax=Candida dubliniensis (strain CD36 / ATCC MYA-646 / CBS 7987 / NCPF 3949 / NRRL Y-17841) TaxID=573826 RepID=B9WDE8_CANDC|nr:mitochondrial 37S ribosomal protein MRP1 [Candida dubliniensis CD36]CAX42701.1 mitochondrial ribosomal protein precursor, small subunit [Candida dubliniensis CD36]
MIRRSSLIFTRSISTSFSLPVNKTLEIFKATNANFEGLFTNNAINQLWFQRGQQLVQNLNQHLAQTNNGLLSDTNTSGTNDNGNENIVNYSLNEIVSITMNKPELFHIHKNATNLYNLQFFFENIRQLEQQPQEIIPSGPEVLLKTPKDQFKNVPSDKELVDWIEHSFGSIQELRNLIINSAKGIKGDGTVWLVAESTMSENYLSKSNFSSPLFHNLAIVNTYNGGMIDDSERSGQLRRMKSVLQQQQQQEEEEEGEGKSTENKQKNNSTSEFELGSVEQAELETAFHNKRLVPALAIDVSPRNYLIDYGAYGKQQYLENVWECIDWDIVLRRLPPRSKQVITV